MMFSGRNDAAQQLAKRLQGYSGMHPVVLGIPRGAIGMACIVAESLGGDVDIVLVRKLRSPDDPELAIGAIDETGWSYLSPFARDFVTSMDYIEQEKKTQLALLKARRLRYTPDQAPLDLSGRIAIVVDDGLATGATMRAALHLVRARQPSKLVCAVPVASSDGLRGVRPYADEIVCLAVPTFFGSVGNFYRSFPEVTDEEVISLLREARRKERIHP